MWTFLALIGLLAGDASGGEEEAVRSIGRGRYDEALATLRDILDGPAGERLDPRKRRSLSLLRARCLFEIGDYPASETALRALLEASREGSPEEVECLVRLAQVLSLEDAHEAALEALRRALSREAADRVALSRAGIPIALRALRHGEAAELAAAVLERDPRDPLARFARGVARAKEGRLAEAVPDLERGLESPSTWRDARFELALAMGKSGRPADALIHLLEILLRDPWDEEACYQATRQLLRTGNRQAVATAAHLMRYLESLKEASGPSSRDHHFQAAGQAAFASLLRAARWERLGDGVRLVHELERAETVGKGDPEALLAAADFWARQGILGEAARVIHGLPGARGMEAGGSSPPARKALEEIEKRREALRGQASTPVGLAALELAEVPFAEAGPRLAKLLAAAEASHAGAEAGRAARLLLAVDPRSTSALRHMVEITRDPTLLVPRLHHLSRLAEACPEDAGLRAELASARGLFLGSRQSTVESRQ